MNQRPSRSSQLRTRRTTIQLSIVAHALAIILSATAAARVFLAKHSVMFFARYYLSIQLAIHQEVWAQFFLRTRRGQILACRGHGKTELTSKLLILWLIVRNRNVRIKLVCSAAELATLNAMVVREELEQNERLKADFGDFYHPKYCRQWTQSKFTVIRKKNLKDPTVDAIGIDSKTTGGRCDYLILDDLIDTDMVNTADLIAKTLAKVRETLLPLLVPNGSAWMIGTRKHFDDIYAWALKSKVWRTLVAPAIKRYPERYEYIDLVEPKILDDYTEQWVDVRIHTHDDSGKPLDQGEVLWDSEWPMKRLLLQKYELGSLAFNREYQMEVVSDEFAQFKRGWLEQCRDEQMSYVIGDMTPEQRSQYVFIGQGVDPSLKTKKSEAEKSKSDFMVQIGGGLTRRGERHLLMYDRERGRTPDEVFTAISNFNTRLLMPVCCIESNSFGEIYAYKVKTESAIKVKEHQTTGTNKHDPQAGVFGLSALFETRRIRLPYRTDEDKRITDVIIDELHSYPAGVHDDIVMALWILDTLFQRFLIAQARRRKQQQQREKGRVTQ